MLFEPTGAGNPLKAQEDKDSVPASTFLSSFHPARVECFWLLQKEYYYILFKFKADFKSNSTTHLTVIITPATCILSFMVVIITNIEISMERSLHKTQAPSLPFSVLQTVMIDIISCLWLSLSHGFWSGRGASSTAKSVSLERVLLRKQR